jgi:Protein of unknown function (DUF2851)
LREDFLHFIWQFQLFNKKGLQTKSNLELSVLNPGTPNSDSGPDFLNSRIQIGDLEWNGHVEIHLKSSDWKRHGHGEDPNYNSVILHVVLEHDFDLEIEGEKIETLELKGRVFFPYLKSYERLLKEQSSIPCKSFIRPENTLPLRSMLDRLLLLRLERKTGEFEKILQENKGDWEESIFKWTCQYFGFKKNNEGFRELADILSWKTVRKLNSSLISTESLLFGTSGFLKSKGTDYQKELWQEFRHLSRKFELSKKVIDSHRWIFFRMRPSNFPTLRIAQLAAFFKDKSSLLDSILSFNPKLNPWKFFSEEVSPFWKSHVHFGEGDGELKGGKLGRKSEENLALNIIPPILYSYSNYSGNKNFVDQAISIYEALPAENNKVIRNWKELGFEMENGFDSQGFLELQKSFCDQKKCLRCNLGVSIVREEVEPY